MVFHARGGIIRIPGWKSLEECGESGMIFHIVRDHPDHGVEILGGMWGARYDLFNIVRDHPDQGAEILGGMWRARYDLLHCYWDRWDREKYARIKAENFQVLR